MRNPVNGDGGILTDLACDAVEETFLQPLPGFGHADQGVCILVTLQERGANAGMERCIIGAHIVL